ncbi:hypothetical protein CHH59_03130 [Shouchella clausii]|uniref:hypothetical protein n=1 Tax=Shouchella clausii TaxID=79880 RepID=UPI000BC57F7D|nr:hypothetical protein [Shouchella clausii]PAF15612.1 hypothetical protein CHH59_03130 [Shouchella clausii]
MMDVKQKLLMLFEHNKIDIQYFDLHAFSNEATVFIKKIQDVKKNNPQLKHEPIFSLQQLRGGSDR